MIKIVKDWANEKLPKEYDPLGLALADLVERLNGLVNTKAPDGLRELQKLRELMLSESSPKLWAYGTILGYIDARINSLAASASAPAAEYPHLPICNGDRRFPAGVPGHCCCCLNIDMQTEARRQRAAQPPAPKVEAASMLLSQKCIWSESMQGWIAPNKRTHDNLVELFNRLAATPVETPPALRQLGESR